VETANLVLAYIQALVWPVLVVVALLLGATLFVRWLPRPASTSAPMQVLPGGGVGTSGAGRVAAVMADAEELASLEAGLPVDPVVHLQQAVRLTPSGYRDAARQISEHFRAGHVVIVDLATVEENVASRLVDFCSGTTLGSRGLFYQVSSTVLLLTPRIQRSTP
jgi:SepF-like predicted cell division protein (DUF552 family)